MLTGSYRTENPLVSTCGGRRWNINILTYGGNLFNLCYVIKLYLKYNRHATVCQLSSFKYIL